MIKMPRGRANRDADIAWLVVYVMVSIGFATWNPLGFRRTLETIGASEDVCVKELCCGEMHGVVPTQAVCCCRPQARRIRFSSISTIDSCSQSISSPSTAGRVGETDHRSMVSED